MRLNTRWGRTVHLGRIAGAIVVAALAVCSLFASAAGAKVIHDQAIHSEFRGMPPELGILPSPEAVEQASKQSSSGGQVGAAGAPTCNSGFEPDCHSLLKNPDENQVQHAEKDYLLFWAPSGHPYPSGYVAGMQEFLTGLSWGDYRTDHATGTHTGNPLSVTQQYYDLSGPGGAKRFVPLAIQNAGTIMDTDAYPANSANGQQCTDNDTANGFTFTPTTCLTAADLGAEVSNFVTTHDYPTGINVEYFVLTPPNVGSCDSAGSAITSCAMGGYCAWHSYTTTGSTETTFANMPFLYQTPCDTQNYVNNNGTDPVVGTFSHELAETMTDPLLNAWRGTGGGSDEIGDKCAYQYVTGDPTLASYTGLPNNGSGYYNATLNGRNYLLQMEFDNSANNGNGGCVQWDPQTQPTATLSGPNSVNRGSSATFSLTAVNAPPGVAYVTWTFGDGSTTTTTGNTPVHHIYQVAASRTVTAILTDKHGNEVKRTKVITVQAGGGGLPASLKITVSPKNPAPRAAYTLKFTGRALSGGTLGGSHNRSELNVYEQFSGTCATTWAAEKARSSATNIGYSLLAAGPFSVTTHRTATSSKHTTVRFCGYVSRSASETDAHATASYTST